MRFKNGIQRSVLGDGEVSIFLLNQDIVADLSTRS